MEINGEREENVEREREREKEKCGPTIREDIQGPKPN